jgi:hypothetical protein
VRSNAPASWQTVASLETFFSLFFILSGFSLRSELLSPSEDARGEEKDKEKRRKSLQADDLTLNYTPVFPLFAWGVAPCCHKAAPLALRAAPKGRFYSQMV